MGELQAELFDRTLAGSDLGGDDFFGSKHLRELQRELTEQKSKLLKTSIEWLVAYRFMVDWDEKVLSMRDPTESQKRRLAAYLNFVSGLGELLLHRLKADESIRLKDALGLDYCDIDACVDDLQGRVGRFKRDLSPIVSDKMASFFGGGRA